MFNFLRVIMVCMAIYGLIWLFMVLCGRFIVFNGLLWQNIDLIGLVSFFLAVIDPNSFGLVCYCCCSSTDVHNNSIPRHKYINMVNRFSPPLLK